MTDRKNIIQQLARIILRSSGQSFSSSAAPSSWTQFIQRQSSCCHHHTCKHRPCQQARFSTTIPRHKIRPVPVAAAAAAKGNHPQQETVQHKLSSQHKSWTPTEDDIIRESLAFPDDSAGIQFAIDLLPLRLPDRIRSRRLTLRSTIRVAREPWTPEEEQKLKSLLDQGLRPFEIRRHFPRRTMVSITRRCYVDRPDPKDVESQEESDTDESKEPQETGGPQYNPIRRRQWTDDELDRIQQEIDVRIKNQTKKKKSKEPLPPSATSIHSDVIASLMGDPEWQRGVEMTRERVQKMMAIKIGEESPVFHSRQRSSPTNWMKDEEKRAIAAIKNQIGSCYLPRLSFQQQHLVPSPTGDAKSYLTPNIPELNRIDWQVVADKVRTRSFHGCERWFYDHQSLRRKGTWTFEEKKRLEEGVTKYGSDAMALSKHVGTRSPKQCAAKLWDEGRSKA